MTIYALKKDGVVIHVSLSREGCEDAQKALFIPESCRVNDAGNLVYSDFDIVEMEVVEKVTDKEMTAAEALKQWMANDE